MPIMFQQTPMDTAEVNDIGNEADFGREPVPSPPATPTRLNRARHFSKQIKSTTKALFNSTEETDVNSDEDDLFQDAAFDPQQVLEANPNQHGSLRGRLNRGIRAAAETIQHPRQAARNRITKATAGALSTHPHATAGHNDEELLEAHNLLAKAESAHEQCESDSESVDKERIHSARERVREAEDRRDSLRNAWVLGRHVQRAVVDRPDRFPPRREEFYEEKDSTSSPRFQWERYLAHLLLWHCRSFTHHRIHDIDSSPFDLRDLALTFERLAVISAPWQSFCIEVRKVSRWEDPHRTMRWCILYCVLWHFEHISTFCYAWIVCATVGNRYNHTGLQSIQDRIRRGQDETAKAQAWSELIEKHGKENWIEPLLDELGPRIQFLMGDAASLLEILQSFYRWERPGKTTATLVLCSTGVFFCLLTSTATCVKFVWMLVGWFFFVSFPIGSRYPQYRHLVYALYWTLWDIPDSAELAIFELQQKAIVRDADRLRRFEHETEVISTASVAYESDSTEEFHTFEKSEATDSTTLLTSIRSTDKVTFRVLNAATHYHGRLELSRHGFWYADKRKKTYYPYNTLFEIRKEELDETLPGPTSTSTTGSLLSKIQKKAEMLTALQWLPCGLTFTFVPVIDVTPTVEMDVQAAKDALDPECLNLIVSESARDRIFSVVLSWSNLHWHPYYKSHTRNRSSCAGNGSVGGGGEASKAIDKMMKRFMT